MSTTPPVYNFTVRVLIREGKASFTIYDSEGKVFDSTIEVKEPNTQINYTLNDSNSPPAMTFTTPQTDPTDSDLSYTLSDDKKTIYFVDSDLNEGIIKLYLRTELDGTVYTSPDPQIRNGKRT